MSSPDTNLADMLLCPITLQLMTDPVMDCNGHTFERSAIVAWYAAHDTSPITNQLVANKNLTVNYAIKQLLDANSNSAQLAIPSASQIVKTPVKYNQPIVNINQNIIEDQGAKYINLEFKIEPLPEDESRLPLTCICVIDISGSMSERATEYNPNGENDGFSRLDLVKHSLTTIHKSLSDNDELALITFNQYARIVLAPTNVSNTALITSSINELQPGGNTNIWDGLKNAIDIANRIDSSARNINILILTDGVANYNPPRGFIPTFDTYISRGINFNIHTFAYGYEVDSVLLSYIATKGNGIFGYIPDGTMVGTIFINAMSNILATAVSNLTAIITHRGESGNDKPIIIGPLLYGQTRNILVKTSRAILPVINFQTKTKTGILPMGIPSELRVSNTIETDPGVISNILAQNMLINILEDVVNSSDQKKTPHPDVFDGFINFLMQYMASSIRPATPFISDLFTDARDSDPNKGQLCKAVERSSWFNKWGCHYLRSVLRAYKLQQCLNFKDLAPQHFNGPTFKLNQERIETIFSNIAPPEPSLTIPQNSNRFIINNHNSGTQSGTYSTQSYASIPASYYNVSGGCFTGEWLINIPNGINNTHNTHISVSKIKPGDLVISHDSPSGVAMVKCVIKLRINHPIEMISLGQSASGSGGITLYHPFYYKPDVEDSGTVEWQFPVNYTSATHGINPGEYMYDLILDQGHTIATKEGFHLACLGHGITTSPVIAHEYFGTQRVIDDLKDHPDWNSGYITLDNWEFIRDPHSNRVIRLEY